MVKRLGFSDAPFKRDKVPVHNSFDIAKAQLNDLVD